MDKESYPSLTPLTHPWIHEFLGHPGYIRELFEEYGSPLNILNPEPFSDNYREYASVLDKHQLQHLIFFARKANKCQAFVRRARDEGFGVDTASYRELKQCLDAGLAPDKLVLTAAIKNERLLRLAIQHKVLIILDNEDEHRTVLRLAEEMDTDVKVGVRVSGFTVDGVKLYSRFGYDTEEVIETVRDKIAVEEKLEFRGFHFHLNGYSIRERGSALAELIELVDELTGEGVPTYFIDMGGGLLMNYLQDEREWIDFIQELKKSVRGERLPVTFGNNGLGYEMIEGELHGELDTYPYFNKIAKAEYLDQVLSTESRTGEATVAEALRKRNIEFRMEPGRSLLDQAGITLARVVFRKWDSNDDLLVGLDMNRTQLFSSSADFLLDPVVLHQKEPTTPEEAVSGYFVGAYCLEQDVILKRKINLDKIPEPGDIVCFPNSAGYMMHFYESEAHLFELSQNLVLKENSSPPKVEEDSQY